MSINRVFVTGNLTRDPELRQAGATTVLQLGIAVNDRKKNPQTEQWEDVPNYFDVLVWGARGESLSRFLHKGQKVAVSGRLHWNQWQNSEGEKRSKVEIVADDIEFMSARNDQGSAPVPGISGDATSYEPPSQQAPSVEVLTEDIPF
ncbi:MAG: single-stranded DNA-binding protein [Actinomycetia bacterium]|nr:single-stranded DNA-binding protein [Actinomycetes bacterium]